MIRFILVILLLLLNFLGMSQEMQLEECIRYAISHNVTLATATANAKIAKEKYRQSKRNMLPLVETGISGSKLFGKSIDPNTNSYVAEGSILSSEMYLSAQLNIFQGFTRQNTIRYHKLLHLMSKEDAKQSQMEIAFQVMNCYYDVMYYVELLQLTDAQIALTKMNLKNTQKLIEIGLKAESDLLEMQAQEATEIHKKITIKNKKETALLTLKKLMNFPLKQTLRIANEDLPLLASQPLSVDSIYQVAHTHMPLVKKSELNVLASRKNVAIRRGELYPRLLFGGNISSNYANSWKKRVNPDDEDSGYKTVAFNDQISDNVSKRIFLRLNIPIFSAWANRSAIKTAKYEREIAQNELKNTELSLRQEITEEHQQLAALREEQKQLQIKEKAMKEAYKIAEKKLEQGLIGVIAFYTAKNQLANAEIDLLRTQLQAKIKEKTIAFYLGREIY